MIIDDRHYDVIIIGAGIIGANMGFEMAKAGHRTLNIDKLPAAGYGSTANTCAIIRCHYSTWPGVAMAYEGFSHWKDWAGYLDAEDERGHALHLADVRHLIGRSVGAAGRGGRAAVPLRHARGIDAR